MMGFQDDAVHSVDEGPWVNGEWTTTARREPGTQYGLCVNCEHALTRTKDGDWEHLGAAVAAWCPGAKLKPYQD